MRRVLQSFTVWVTPQGMSWCVLAFFVVMLLSIVLASEPWPSRSAFFPMVVAGVAIGLALLETAVAKIPALQKRFAPRDVLDLGMTTDLPDETVKEKSNAAIAWMIFLVVGVALVGFHVTVPIFVVIYLRFITRASWLATSCYTVAAWFLLFVVFDRMLDVRWMTPMLSLW